MISLRQPGIDKPRAALAEPFLGSFALKENASVDAITVEIATLSAADFNTLRVASLAPVVPVSLSAR